MQFRTNELINFRQQLYGLLPKRSDAIFNLLDALSSSGHERRSVVELSESPFFTRQYSSVTDAITNGLPKALFEKIEQLVFNTTQSTNANCFFTDCTSNTRHWAHKLTDKSVVYVPNPAPGNKPIGVGHQYSMIAMAPQENAARAKHWLVPISVERVMSTEKGNEKGMGQLSNLIKNLNLENELTINVGDSLYGTEKCRESAIQNPNLVHIFRMSNKRVIFSQPDEHQYLIKKAGRKKTYGLRMSLSDINTHKEPDHKTLLKIQTKKKLLQIELFQWNNMLIKGSEQFQSARYPINLVRVIIKDNQGNNVFKFPLWIGVIGKRRHEVTSERIHELYSERYDIEHFFRFGKQKLLLDAYQTPDTEHETYWWKFAMWSYFQLYLAAESSGLSIKPWEKYLQNNKTDNQTDFKTPSQIQRIFSNMLKHTGTPAKHNLPRGNPMGRKLGDAQPERPNSKINFKKNNKTTRLKQAIKSPSENTQELAASNEINALLSAVKDKLKLVKLSAQDFALMLVM